MTALLIKRYHLTAELRTIKGNVHTKRKQLSPAFCKTSSGRRLTTLSLLDNIKMSIAFANSTSVIRILYIRTTILNPGRRLSGRRGREAEDSMNTSDSIISFDDHVDKVVRACNYHLRSLRSLRRSLTFDVANTLDCSSTGSRIDYCNALLVGASIKTPSRTQRVWNGLACAVFNVGIRGLQ